MNTTVYSHHDTQHKENQQESNPRRDVDSTAGSDVIGSMSARACGVASELASYHLSLSLIQLLVSSSVARSRYLLVPLVFVDLCVA